MRTIERNIVGALIISSDKKILFGKHPAKSGGVYSDFWIVPGGGIEEGKTRLEDLRREMLEEVNLDISPYEIELIDDTAWGESEKNLKDSGERVRVKMNFIEFEVRLNKSARASGASTTKEFPEITWVPVSKLATVKLAEPTADLMRKQGYLK